jgi:hypothetical protein
LIPTTAIIITLSVIVIPSLLGANMEHINVCASSETVSTLRLLRLLRPIKTRLAALGVFKSGATKDSIDSICESIDSSRSSELRIATAAVRKRTNNTASNIITYSKISRGNSNNGCSTTTGNSSQSSNIKYTYNFGATVSVPITESPHDYINSMRICDAVNDVLRRTWYNSFWIQHYGKQTEWATIEPFAPWKPMKKSSSNNNNNTANDDDVTFSKSYVEKLATEYRIMPLSIIAAFDIGRYAAQIESMARDKEKQG